MTLRGDESSHISNTMRVRRQRPPSMPYASLNHRLQIGVVLLIFGILCFFLVLPSSSPVSSSSSLEKGHSSIRAPLRDRWISEQALPFNQNDAAVQATHLIMVACHSVTMSGHLEDAESDERDWYLLDYQKDRGLPQAIIGHIRAGLQEAAQDPASLLLFSGGETRPGTGPVAEGASYYRVTDAMNLWPAGTNVRARTMSEEFATDSFENLSFSICRFREITGQYPQKITVVSFTFKEGRFMTMHAPALRWPTSQLAYLGVDPPASTGFDLAEASKGEQENAAKPFEQDPYGCHSQILQDKRHGRNPFARTPPYKLSCPEMTELLSYCGPELFAGSLPWA